MRVVCCFIWGKLRTIAQETDFQLALRSCSQGVGGRSGCMWFWWRGYMPSSQAQIFTEGCCLSREADVTIYDFSAFLDTRRNRNWGHKILSWKYLTIWRPVLPVFLRAQRASFLLSTLSSFQGVLKVTSCSSLILAEVDGKCQCLAGSAPSWS